MKLMTTAMLSALCCAPTIADSISVTIENTQSPGGFALTPFWLAMHDGNFQVFDEGAAASTYTGITDIAELGSTAAIAGRFASEQPSGVETTFAEPNGPPVFSPGESAKTTINVMNPMSSRYLSYASMVVPSNDLFVGNDNALEVFDAAGNFVGPITIDIYGSNVWDNGTEVNDIMDGPAFVMGQDAMAGTDESGVVRAFFSDGADTAYINSIIGVITAPGTEITQGFDDATHLGRITITPTPGTAGALIVGVGLAARRRR